MRKATPRRVASERSPAARSASRAQAVWDAVEVPRPASSGVPVRAQVLAPAAVGVLVGLEPGDRPADRRVLGGQARSGERRHDRPRAVDVIGTPAPEPGAVVLLCREQPLHAPGDHRLRAPELGEHLDDVRGHVRARRVDQFAEVAEGELAAKSLGVVDVERAPAAVAALHALDPGHPAVDRARLRAHRSARAPARPRRCRRCRGSCRWRTRRPSRPARGGAPDGPVAPDRDLLVEQVGRGGVEHRVARLQPGVGQRRHGERGVPDGRLAGLEPPPGVVFDGEAVEALETGPHGRVVESVTLQVKGDQRVHPGRLDASPGAVGLLALQDPMLGASQGLPAHQLDRPPSRTA